MYEDGDGDKTLVGRRGGPASLTIGDAVIFIIGDGDQGDDGDNHAKRRHGRQPSGDGIRRERGGLMQRGIDY